MSNTNQPNNQFCPKCGHDLNFIRVQNGINICTARKPPGSNHYCQCDYKPVHDTNTLESLNERSADSERHEFAPITHHAFVGTTFSVLCCQRVSGQYCGQPRNAEIHVVEPPERERFEAISDMVSDHTEDARAKVRSALADSSALVRHEAAFVLGHIGEQRDADLLLDCLNDPSAFVRHESLLAIAELGDRHHGDILKPMLGDPVPEVAASAKIAIEKLTADSLAQPDAPPQEPKFVPPDNDIRRRNLTGDQAADAIWEHMSVITALIRSDIAARSENAMSIRLLNRLDTAIVEAEHDTQ